jgi:FkbM family methyltransferase
LTGYIREIVKDIAGYCGTFIGSKKETLTEKEHCVRRWFADKGDKTLRLNYSLNSDSTVIDLGGYRGDWSAEMFCKYNCNILVFEPVKEFSDFLKQRFSHNPKIKIHTFGLSDSDGTVRIALDEASSSVFKRSNHYSDVELQQADVFLNKFGMKTFDLMKINIEGGEYSLLNHLIETGLITSIDNIQVQFHDFVPDAENRMNGIQKALSKTHHLTYQYRFIWENWKKS